MTKSATAQAIEPIDPRKWEADDALSWQPTLGRKTKTAINQPIFDYFSDTNNRYVSGYMVDEAFIKSLLQSNLVAISDLQNEVKKVRRVSSFLDRRYDLSLASSDFIQVEGNIQNQSEANIIDQKIEKQNEKVISERILSLAVEMLPFVLFGATFFCLTYTLAIFYAGSRQQLLQGGVMSVFLMLSAITFSFLKRLRY